MDEAGPTNVDQANASGSEPNSDSGGPLDPADPLSLVDRELRPAARQMRQAMARFSPMTMELLAERRAWINSLPVASLSDVPFEERRVPGHAGQPDATVFVVNAKPGRAGPGILYIHGGGLTASSAMGSMRNVQELASTLDCPIVSVEYRLAPETLYSDSSEDSYAALLWTYRHALEIGIDPNRIALLGESAGGAHAALLAINARDRGEVPVMFQALIYPMLDDRTGSSHPVPQHIGYFGWNADANSFGWRCFLGQEPGQASAPPGSVPARVDTLAGLPPTFLGVGALDLLVTDSIDYARRLVEAGVPTELVVAPGAFHGFDMIVKDAAISRRFAAAKVDALRRAFES